MSSYWCFISKSFSGLKGKDGFSQRVEERLWAEFTEGCRGSCVVSFKLIRPRPLKDWTVIVYTLRSEGFKQTLGTFKMRLVLTVKLPLPCTVHCLQSCESVSDVLHYPNVRFFLLPGRSAVGRLRIHLQSANACTLPLLLPCFFRLRFRVRLIIEEDGETAHQIPYP